MTNFIEINDKENNKILLNINYIFRVVPLKNDKIAKCRVEQTTKGYNNYPYQYIDTLESYEEIKQLIEAAV